VNEKGGILCVLIFAIIFEIFLTFNHISAGTNRFYVRRRFFFETVPEEMKA